MSTPKIEPWITKAAMEQAREVWPGSAKGADEGKQESILDLCELSQKLAAIIARHAPSEGTNESLLKAAKRASAILPPHFGNPDKAAYQLDEAITAAQSAPASLERELAEAAQPFADKEFTESMGSGHLECSMCNGCQDIHYFMGGKNAGTSGPCRETAFSKLPHIAFARRAAQIRRGEKSFVNHNHENKNTNHHQNQSHTQTR